jgi:hypothetical protein
MVVEIPGVGCRVGFDSVPNGPAAADAAAAAVDGTNAAAAALAKFDTAGASDTTDGITLGTPVAAAAGGDAASPAEASSAAPCMPACGSEATITGSAAGQRLGRGSTTCAGILGPVPLLHAACGSGTAVDNKAVSGPTAAVVVTIGSPAVAGGSVTCLPCRQFTVLKVDMAADCVSWGNVSTGYVQHGCTPSEFDACAHKEPPPRPSSDSSDA